MVCFIVPIPALWDSVMATITGTEDGLAVCLVNQFYQPDNRKWEFFSTVLAVRQAKMLSIHSIEPCHNPILWKQ